MTDGTDPARGGPAEEDLIGRARRGDREAFDGLVGLHLSRVWRVVWRILRHREDTEDVVQEVFLKAFEALPGYRGEAALSTWLHRIAVTRALNHAVRAAEKLRRASRPIDPVGVDAAEPVPAAGAAGAVRPAGPLQALEARELSRRLAACLRKLPADWRAVVALRDGESMSYEEIARVLDLKIGTVRSRLSRARLSLRTCIEGGGS